jgi:molybdopterin-guanine dinucleotide biosynthesis protein A
MSEAQTTSSRDCSFKKLFNRLKVDDLEMNESDKFFTNLNTPEDFHAALS